MSRVIRRMRKRLKNKGWLEDKLIELDNECQKWRSFYAFKCNSFFVGTEMAAYNEKQYNKCSRRANRRRKFIITLLDNFN